MEESEEVYPYIRNKTRYFYSDTTYTVLLGLLLT